MALGGEGAQAVDLPSGEDRKRLVEAAMQRRAKG